MKGTKRNIGREAKKKERNINKTERREGKKSSDLSRAIVEYYCSSN